LIVPITFTNLAIPGVLLIEPHFTGDERGYLMETYKRAEFIAAGITEPFVQENQSRSERDVLRGLHFQEAPHAQSKLIRVVNGEVFDVAVDIRPSSPTYLHWVGVNLSSESRRMVYLPNWCAHGFCVLSDTADVSYLMSTEYAPAHQAGLMWNEPRIGIKWPIRTPTLSERDKKWPALMPVV